MVAATNRLDYNQIQRNLHDHTMPTAPRINVTYRLPQHLELKLREVAYRTDKTKKVRAWIADYIRNPTEITREADTLTRNSVLVDQADHVKLVELANQHGISIMELVRRIVETNLAKPQ